jgi:hypothetical protein
MKQQIARFSPHQNAKVVAILSAVASTIFLVPFMLLAMFAVPPGQRGEFPPIMLVVFPVVYLIFGYLFTVIGCALYNLLFRLIGGFEYEARDSGA